MVCTPEASTNLTSHKLISHISEASSQLTLWIQRMINTPPAARGGKFCISAKVTECARAARPFVTYSLLSPPLPLPQTQDTWRRQGRSRLADTCLHRACYLHHACYLASCCIALFSACVVEGWMPRRRGSGVALTPFTLSTVSLRPRHCEHLLSFDCALSCHHLPLILLYHVTTSCPLIVLHEQ